MEIKLGESIRRLRKESGFTQVQLAEALGVSVSAVHKWESGKATPELEMLVDIAEFFETSVDAMLNYGWQKLSMGQAVEKLRQFARDRQLADGIRFAEKALQKYPNNFEIVWECTNIYFLTMGEEVRFAQRATELYQHSIQLVDQNEDTDISLVTINNQIAYCYYYMGRKNDAIELLQRNNVEGVNDSMIGLLMSQDPVRAKESLEYLSDALYGSLNTIFMACSGYVNAFSAMGKYGEVEELVRWLLEAGKGLRNEHVVTYQDKTDVLLYTVLASMAVKQGKEQESYLWLKKARQAALRFDAAPQFKTGVGLKYYFGSDTAVSYDNIGQTAMKSIENIIFDENADRELVDLWTRIQAED